MLRKVHTYDGRATNQSVPCDLIPLSVDRPARSIYQRCVSAWLYSAITRLPGMTHFCTFFRPIRVRVGAEVARRVIQVSVSMCPTFVECCPQIFCPCCHQGDSTTIIIISIVVPPRSALVVITPVFSSVVSAVAPTV